MHYVYILFSPKTKRYYVGETAFPEGRLLEHNGGKYAKASTRHTDDWKIEKLISFVSRSEALKIERYLKNMKSRAFIESLILDTAYYQKFHQLVFEKFGIKILV